jgi:hypothetical protein
VENSFAKRSSCVLNTYLADSSGLFLRATTNHFLSFSVATDHHMFAWLVVIVTSFRSVLSDPIACDDVLEYCAIQLEWSSGDCVGSGSTVMCDWPEWDCEFTLYSRDQIGIECWNSKWLCVSEVDELGCSGYCSNRGLSGWAIAGIIIAVIVIFALVGSVICICLRKRHRSQDETQLDVNRPVPEAAPPISSIPSQFVPPDAPTPYGASPFAYNPVYASPAYPGVPMAYPQYPADDDDKVPAHYAFPARYNPM